MLHLLLACADDACETACGDDPADTTTSEETTLPAPLRVEGFQTPESVFYDAARDRYLVSNIVGNPQDHDGDGYIAILAPDGTVAETPFAAGLDGPKGMTLREGTLYVTDIDVVRAFDAETGAAGPVTPLDGSTFLNDLATMGDRVLVSDSSADRGPAIWSVGPDGEAESWVDAEDLARPNGLATDGSVVYAVSGSTFFTIDSGRVDAVDVGSASLDGIVITTAGDILISSWEAEAVFSDATGAWEVIAADLSSPADIGYDEKRHRLLVPLFQEDAVQILQL